MTLESENQVSFASRFILVTWDYLIKIRNRGPSEPPAYLYPPSFPQGACLPAHLLFVLCRSKPHFNRHGKDVLPSTQPAWRPLAGLRCHFTEHTAGGFFFFFLRELGGVYLHKRKGLKGERKAAFFGRLWSRQASGKTFNDGLFFAHAQRGLSQVCREGIQRRPGTVRLLVLSPLIHGWALCGHLPTYQEDLVPGAESRSLSPTLWADLILFDYFSVLCLLHDFLSLAQVTLLLLLLFFFSGANLGIQEVWV